MGRLEQNGLHGKRATQNLSGVNSKSSHELAKACNNLGAGAGGNCNVLAYNIRASKRVARFNSVNMLWWVRLGDIGLNPRPLTQIGNLHSLGGND